MGLDVPVEDAAAVEEEEGREQVHRDLQHSAMKKLHEVQITITSDSQQQLHHRSFI